MTSHALMSSLKVCCRIFWNDIAALPALTVNIGMRTLLFPFSLNQIQPTEQQ